MTPLDPVSSRLFPTLARYARRTRRLALVCSHALLFLAGMAVTFLWLGYHQYVVTEAQGRLVGRISAIEEQYERDHKHAMVTTKTQANDAAWKREKEGRP